MEGDRDHRQRGDPDGQVDVEDPPPRQVVDEEPSEQRADHRRDAEHRAEEPLVAAAVARREDVADDGHGGHDQPSAPRPWRARKAMSSPMSWERPQSAEPTRKITIAACSTILRP